jgi:hypothetical protein
MPTGASYQVKRTLGLLAFRLTISSLWLMAVPLLSESSQMLVECGSGGLAHCGLG